MQKKIFFIVGPSGVGKGTLVNQLRERHPEFCFPPSVTTRPPRSGEVTGQQYEFVSEDEFANYEKNGELLEWALVHGLYRYGTLKKLILDPAQAGQVVIREVDIQGLVSIRQNLAAELFCAIFVAPPDLEALHERILRRQPDISAEELTHRLASAEKELAQKELADVVVTSREGEMAELVEKVERVIIGGGLMFS
jgi:guanylate kinase